MSDLVIMCDAAYLIDLRSCCLKLGKYGLMEYSIITYYSIYRSRRDVRIRNIDGSKRVNTVSGKYTWRVYTEQTLKRW